MYNSYVTGEFIIEPAMDQGQIDSLGMGENDDAELLLENMGAEDTVELINGTITVVPGKRRTRVSARYGEEPYKAYGLGTEINTLVVAVRKFGLKMNGAMYLNGEESPDLSRYRVTDNAGPMHEQPKFVWPNGDEGWTP